MNDTYVYEIDGNIYINLTNRCSNACEFCVRNTHKQYETYNLWLTKEPTAEDVIALLPEDLKGREVVFCGYGEPLYRLDAIEEIAEVLKKRGAKTVRINTNGQAGLIVGDGVAKRIRGLIDKVSVSLNAVNSREYQKICRCRFGELGYFDMLKFAKEAADEGIEVVFSVISTMSQTDIEKARQIAERVGAKLRVRELIV